jgi:hypothetical protein
MAPRDTRQNTVPATWGPGRAGTPRRPAARVSGGKKQCRQKGTGRAAGLALRPQYAGGGTGSWRPRVGCGGTRRNRPGSGSHHSASCCGRRCAAVLAAIVSATVRGPVASARDDPRRPAAISARPQHRQLPSRTPGMTCRHSRPESRKGAERRAGIRNLCPFRIPVLPRAPITHPRSGFSRGGRSAERSARPFRWASGMRCRADGHSRLPAEKSASRCGHAASTTG